MLRKGPEKIRLKTEFTILGIKIQIITNSNELDHRVQDIKVHAKDSFPVSGALTIEVLQKEGEYVILEQGEELVSSTDAEWVTLYLHELINFRVSWHMRELIKIHAASGSLGGKRFLLAGDKGAGKTTLVTRLLFEDASIYGDETILLRGSDAIPFPRKFHLKEGTPSLVPQIALIYDKLTSYPAYYGGRFCFFDPTDAGFDWQITTGKLDAIFYLEPRHQERTEIEECPKWLLAQKLMLQASDFAANPESQIAQLCHVVEMTDNFIIHFGDLDRAVLLLKELLA